jgi:hypothetical protein
VKVNFQQAKVQQFDATWNIDQSLNTDKLKTQTQEMRLQINDNTTTAKYFELYMRVPRADIRSDCLFTWLLRDAVSTNLLYSTN